MASDSKMALAEDAQVTTNVHLQVAWQQKEESEDQDVYGSCYAAEEFSKGRDYLDVHQRDAVEKHPQGSTAAMAGVCRDACLASLQDAHAFEHDSTAWLKSYSLLRIQTEWQTTSQHMRGSIASSTLAASKALIARKETPSPSTFTSANARHAPPHLKMERGRPTATVHQPPGSDVSALTTSPASNVSLQCATPNISACDAIDRLDLPEGHVLVVPSERRRRPLAGHLEAELLRRTTLGLLAPWPLPAFGLVTLLRGPESTGYPFLAEQDRRDLVLLRVPKFTGDFSVAGWQATRHLRKAMELVVHMGAEQTVVFHGVWGLGPGTRRKVHQEGLAARVLLNATAGLPLKVLVQTPRGLSPIDMQGVLQGYLETLPEHSRQRSSKQKRQRT